MDNDSSGEADQPNESQSSAAESSSTMDASDQSLSRSNPFDARVLETKRLPTFTPSVFERVTSPSSGHADSPVSRPSVSRRRSRGRCRKFRWSIDHIAAMNPTDINEEELALQESSEAYDAKTEACIQAAIDRFFSQPLIAPSPWKPPDSTSCEPVVVQSPWKKANTPNFKTPDSDYLETSVTDVRGKLQFNEDINSSVFLLSSSDSEDECSSQRGPKMAKSSHRSSFFDMRQVSSPEISPIKNVSPVPNGKISPIPKVENVFDELTSDVYFD